MRSLGYSLNSSFLFKISGFCSFSNEICLKGGDKSVLNLFSLFGLIWLLIFSFSFIKGNCFSELGSATVLEIVFIENKNLWESSTFWFSGLTLFSLFSLLYSFSGIYPLL